MRIAGNPLDKYEFILHIAFAIISGALIVFQANFIQKMKILPVYFIVIVSVCYCYENSIMAAGNQLEPDSAAVQILYALQALQIPLLTICMFETVVCLYEEKGASLELIDAEDRQPTSPVYTTSYLWSMRFVAVCLLVLSLLVNYQLIPDQDYMEAGSGGYIYLAKHPYSLPVWLALIPPIVLSIVGLICAYFVQRYGNEYTISVTYLYKWKILIPAALAQAVGHIFGVHVYPITSNAGELALLIGTTFFLYLAQDDLILTAHFADFLHRSNAAFGQVEALDPQTWSHHHDRVLHVPSVSTFTGPNSERDQLTDSRNPSQHSSRVGLPPLPGHSQHGLSQSQHGLSQSQHGQSQAGPGLGQERGVQALIPGQLKEEPSGQGQAQAGGGGKAAEAKGEQGVEMAHMKGANQA